MHTFFLKIFVVFFLLFTAGAVQAQDSASNAELYDAVPPPESSFVRTVNLSTKTILVNLSGTEDPQSVAPGQLSPYRFVPKGQRVLTIVGHQHSLNMDLTPDTGNTVIFDGTQLTILADTFDDDRRKAQIGFYNFTPQNVSLKTSDGKYIIVDSVGRNQTKGRKVNELKVSLAAYIGEERISEYQEFFLRKGRSYSYLLFSEDNGYRAVVLENSIDAVK